MNKIKQSLKFFLQRLTKNQTKKTDYALDGKVKLYYFKLSKDSENLGDYLSKVVVSHFMPETKNNKKGKKRTLYAIGSILGFRCQDAVVWGSGILSNHPSYKKYISASKLDIRAVRGPKTRQILLGYGKNCPEIYGDPAILMPLIYKPKDTRKKHKYSLVLHYEHNKFSIPQNEDIEILDIKTTDYQQFIDKIVQSEVVISSSLHGVILAETYGVPAILLLKKEAIFFKFEDWYNSTGRYNILVARTVEEALTMSPMDLPDLSKMQQQLIESFPTDLWEK